ncbi:hypothetical protein TRVL_00768 [Trypanosoma vivax]|nr:hypothetical protein TRVL_00768 [Trypanosoma vivax]
MIRLVVLHLLLGQLVAFLNSLTGVFTTLLVNNGTSYPLLQSTTAYGFIFTVYSPLFLILYYRHRHARFSNFIFLSRPWRYAILAVIDVQANFVVVKAFQYTNLVSVQLLSCFTIPFAICLSFFVLGMRFAVTHVAGCIVATGGFVLLVLLDADGVSRDDVGSSVVKGDLLCVLGASLYALSNVLTEYFIKPRDTTDRLNRLEEASNLVLWHPVTPAVAGDGSQPLPEQEADTGVIELRQLEQSQPFEGSGVEVPLYIPIVQNLACMSGFALVFSSIQFFSLEWIEFNAERERWSGKDCLYHVLFGLSMLMVYTGLPSLFLITSAVFANVSLLSTSVYGIVWNVTIFHIYPTPVFWGAFVIIILGSLLYSLSDKRWPWCPRANYPCDKQVLVENPDVNSPENSGPASSPSRETKTTVTGPHR